VLIFVHSRKETAKTAMYLKQTALDNDHLAKFMRDDSASREILQVGVVQERHAGEACRHHVVLSYARGQASSQSHVTVSPGVTVS
jgi:hypothetical protein